MSKIRPFKGIRPVKEKATMVAALPYDVMTTEEAKKTAENNPISFLHIEKSEIDFPLSFNPYSDEVYKKGAENLRKMVQDKILKQDPKPCYYLYQQQMGNHVQIGLVAGASVEEYNSGLIKKHEHTRKDKEDDRTRHVELINANTGPVFLTYPHKFEIDSYIQKLSQKPAEVDFTAEDGIKHTFWVIDDNSAIDKITQLFEKIPALYVADGHHRSAAASRVYNLKKANNAKHTGEEGYSYFLTVIFPDNQMYIMDYNRVLKDVSGLTENEILEKLAVIFEIQKLKISDPEEAKPKFRSHFSMFLNGSWYQLVTKKQYIPQNDPVNSLDVAILQNNVLAPLFKIEDPRTDKKIDFVGGIRGMKELERRCKVDAKLAFALYPTGIDQLIAIADAGKVMPPKSTWFEPKLRSGMIVRTLD